MTHRNGARTRKLAAAAVWALWLAGCASFAPTPVEQVDFRAGEQVQEVEGLRVAVAVPDRNQARALFGVDLWANGMQPVWIEVSNDTELPYSVFFSMLDPMYFSAHEAAYESHKTLRPVTNERIDEHFDALGIDPYVDPGTTSTGFVLTNKDEGTKHVRVGLVGPGKEHIFEFDVPVPGLKLDWESVDWLSLYSDEDLVTYTDEEAFAQALRELPCCTTRQSGRGEGDPINLVFVGSGELLHSALTRTGWDETERLTFTTAWRTFVAAITGGEYRYSPMSSLYFYGRPQDAGFQKARSTIHQRNHLRVWLAPMLYRDQFVWVGTITRDIGVYFTTKAWNLTTHAIDPYVDEARKYLTEDLLLSQMTQRFGYVVGVGEASRDDPHYNLMLAPWWSDGHRAVFMLGSEPSSVEEVRFLYWDWPGFDPDEPVNDALRKLLGDR